jgi:hypothetical protein
LHDSNLARVTPEGGYTWTYGMKSTTYALDLIRNILLLTFQAGFACPTLAPA